MMKRKKLLTLLCGLSLLLTACNVTDDSWYTDGYEYKPVTGDAKNLFDYPEDSISMLANLLNGNAYEGGIVLSGKAENVYAYHTYGNTYFLVASDPAMTQIVSQSTAYSFDNYNCFALLVDSYSLIPGATYYYCLNSYIDHDTSRPGMLDRTKHSYYDYSYNSDRRVSGEIKSFTFSGLPRLMVEIIREYNATIVNCGVFVYKNNPVTEMGICYSTTNQLPTTADTKWEAEGIQNSNNLSFFEANISDLLEPLNGENYHLRAYVTTKGGTVYSEVFDYPGTR